MPRKVIDNEGLREIALRAGLRAAQFIKSATRPLSPSDWNRKGARDYVTEVDRESERLIAEVLLSAARGSIMVGEELSPEYRTGKLVWVVDPLDGTTNYLHGYPACAVSIAAVREGTIVAGAIVDVFRGDAYSAAAGAGAFLEDVRLSVSTLTDPEAALIGTGFPFKHPDLIDDYLAQFRRILAATSGVRRAGSAALDLADVARGRFDGFWELRLAPWDVAAGVLLVREAGGRITNLAGAADVLTHGPIVAGNPAVHAWLLQALKP